jgi:hypothetical protein
MAEQHEWTKPLEKEPESYPGVLRGYRHFGKGVSLRSVHSDFDYSQITEDQWWESKCGTGKSWQPKEDHETPASTCQCGFYVNYYPINSFYDKKADEVNPRGVVEASGRMVLGTKGFRAQKLRLIALTPISWGLGSYVQESFPWVKLYNNVEEMYEDFPQDDLTSLIGEDVVKKNLNPSLMEQLASQPLVDWSKYAGPQPQHTVWYDSNTNTYSQRYQNGQYTQNYMLSRYGRGINGIWEFRFPNGVGLTYAPYQDYARIELPGHFSPSYQDFVNSDPTRIMPNPNKIIDLKLSQIQSTVTLNHNNELVKLELSDPYCIYIFDMVTGDSKVHRRY